MASPSSRSVLPAFLFLFLLCRPSPCSSSRCDKADKRALLAIKQFWGNPFHFNTWIPANGCCDWYGVECDATTNRVTSLAIFDDTNLSGTIPPAVGDLSELNYLIIRKLPNLVGPIVPDLTRLTKLTFLSLDWNSLSGPVPSFLASIPSLTYIKLSFNKFTGAIPPELPSLRNLTFLGLDRNRLTGSIPESFGEFSDGSTINLSHNNLTGQVPRSLGVVDFDELDLSRNQLSGDASFLFRPWNISGNPKIDISRNAFEFDLSKVEFPLKIVWLDINHNKIYGSIPKQLATLEYLMFMNVTYNRLCGEIPTGGRLSQFDQSTYAHNRCLCGTPLPPCK